MSRRKERRKRKRRRRHPRRHPPPHYQRRLLMKLFKRRSYRSLVAKLDQQAVVGEEDIAAPALAPTRATAKKTASAAADKRTYQPAHRVPAKCAIGARIATTRLFEVVGAKNVASASIYVAVEPEVAALRAKLTMKEKEVESLTIQ